MPATVQGNFSCYFFFTILSYRGLRTEISFVFKKISFRVVIQAQFGSDTMYSEDTRCFMARIRLDHVKKEFDDGFVAVKDASFEIADGEFMVLVGPSGCGKSTTLRMVAGLEDISSGDLYIGENRVNDIAPKDRDVAMVFQNYALYPHMTIRENMAFGLKLRKYPKAEIKQRVDQAAQVLGIADILDRKPSQLSGGQRQRVAVGRAIVRKPKVFLFDEPLSNLDAKLRVQMRTEIAKLHHRLGATMLYVTHDQVEAMTMGDRIVVMRDGVIQQIDTPLNLYNQPANRFVAGFIGSPAMNFFGGRLVREDGLAFESSDRSLRLPLAGPVAPGLKPDTNILLGVRPEDLYLQSGEAPESRAGFSVQLEVLEPMGHEIVAYAKSGEHSVVARLAPQAVPDPGASMMLFADLEKLHFFDASSEETITKVA